MNPTLGILLVLTTLGLLFATVRTLKHRRIVGPESSRKLVHIGMGCVCLTFPWLFANPVQVWILAGLACTGLLIMRLVPALKTNLGGVLHDVDRFSLGELYFPLGVAAIFTLSNGEWLPFVVPVSLLTFADAAGALLGRAWGRHHYETLEGRKSVEGSAAVALTALACATIPLWLAGQAFLPSFLIGAIIGLFAALVEAVSWRGLDNIFLPLVAYTQLGVYLSLTTWELGGRFAMLSTLIVGAVFGRFRPGIGDAPRLTTALLLFIVWALGDWRWLIAPSVLLILGRMVRNPQAEMTVRHNLRSIASVAAPAAIWCVAHAIHPSPTLVVPFSLSFATHQAMIGTVRLTRSHSSWSRWRCWAAALGLTLNSQAGVFAATLGICGQTGFFLCCGMVITTLISLLFVLLEKELGTGDPYASGPWCRQTGWALLASVLGFAVCLL